MWSRTFAELLDDALTTPPVDAGASHRPAQPFATRPHPLLFFTLPKAADPEVRFPPTTFGPVGPSLPWSSGPIGEEPRADSPALAAAEPARHPGVPPGVEEVRPVRPLSPAQRHALDGLLACGAELTVHFTAADLRREYRRLARRVHPDRHRDATDAERERLSRQFAAATDHYRSLLASLEPRN